MIYSSSRLDGFDDGNIECRFGGFAMVILVTKCRSNASLEPTEDIPRVKKVLTKEEEEGEDEGRKNRGPWTCTIMSNSCAGKANQPIHWMNACFFFFLSYFFLSFFLRWWKLSRFHPLLPSPESSALWWIVSIMETDGAWLTDLFACHWWNRWKWRRVRNSDTMKNSKRRGPRRDCIQAKAVMMLRGKFVLFTNLIETYGIRDRCETQQFFVCSNQIWTTVFLS